MCICDYVGACKCAFTSIRKKSKGKENTTAVKEGKKKKRLNYLSFDWMYSPIEKSIGKLIKITKLNRSETREEVKKLRQIKKKRKI